MSKLQVLTACLSALHELPHSHTQQNNHTDRDFIIPNTIYIECIKL